MKRGNLFRRAGPKLRAERFETLAAGPGCRIECIVSAGQATPPGRWYDQTRDEWVALLAGSVTLGFEGGREVALGPGDWLLIPAHVRHRVERTSAAPPCVWVAVHFGPGRGPARRKARGS